VYLYIDYIHTTALYYVIYSFVHFGLNCVGCLGLLHWLELHNIHTAVTAT